MTFFLGTHKPGWLSKISVPLCVSHRWLRERETMPRALAPWLLDSGGFTELEMHGRWTVRPSEYITAVRRYAEEVGSLAHAAIQDWMCEPWMVKKTGLSIREHQERTVRSYLILRDAAPELPWLPTLQGWLWDDYRRHAEMYAPYVDLEAAPLVGLGSVCRRQRLGVVAHIIERLKPLRIHAFGLKLTGLDAAAHLLASADSLAWSRDARYGRPFSGCLHKSCANCATYALRWREKVLGIIAARLRSRPHVGQLEFLC